MSETLDWTGVLSKTYESSGDAGAVSAKYVNGKWVLTNPKDVGGYSFGSYQIASGTSTMDTFINYLNKNQSLDSDSYYNDI